MYNDVQEPMTNALMNANATNADVAANGANANGATANGTSAAPTAAPLPNPWGMAAQPFVSHVASLDSVLVLLLLFPSYPVY
jgi:hypothetical protein